MSAIALALLAACSRYEYVNELDVPGRCPAAGETERARSARPALRYAAASALSADSLRGWIVEADTSGQQITDRSIHRAEVVLLDDDARPTYSDSTGKFSLAVPAAVHYGLRVRALGYHARVDTLRLPLAADTAVVIALRPIKLDGACSGFAAVRVRKPWWKWW